MKDVASVPVAATNGRAGEKNAVLKSTKEAVVAGLTNGESRAAVVVNGHADTNSAVDVNSYQHSVLNVSDSSDSEHILELELSDDEPPSSGLSLAGSTTTRSTATSNPRDAVTDKGIEAAKGSSSSLEKARTSSPSAVETSVEGGENVTPVAVENATSALVAVVENGERCGASTPDCVIIAESRSGAIVDSKPSALAPSKAATDDASTDIHSLPEQEVVEEEPSKVEEDTSGSRTRVDNDAGQTGKSGTAQAIGVVELDGAGKAPAAGTEDNVTGRLAESGVENRTSEDRCSSERNAKEPPPVPEITVIDIDDSSSDSNAGNSSTGELATDVDEVAAKPEARDNNASAMSFASGSEDDDRLQLDTSDEQKAAVTANEVGNLSAQELETDESNVDSEPGSAATLMNSDSALAESSEATVDEERSALSEVADEAGNKAEVADTTVDISESGSAEIAEVTGDKVKSASADIADATVDISESGSAEIAEVTGDEAESASADIADATVDITESGSSEIAEATVDRADSVSAEHADVTVDKAGSASAADAEATGVKTDHGSADIADATVEKIDIVSAEIADSTVDKTESASAADDEVIVDKTDSALSATAEATVNNIDSASAKSPERAVHKTDSALSEVAVATVDKLQFSSAVVEQAEGTSCNDVEDGGETRKKPASSALEIVEETSERIVTAVVNVVDGTAEKSVNAVIANDEQAGCSKQDEIVASSLNLEPPDVISIDDDSSEESSLSGGKIKDEPVGEKATVKPATSTVAATADSAPESSTSLDNDGDVHTIKIEKRYVEVKASSSETDDSKTLLDVTSKPSNDNMTTTEGSPKRPKRSSASKPEDELLPKRVKQNNGEDQTPNGVRSVSKENLNPASQKRGSTSTLSVEEAKKARIETLRERKPSKKKQEMSNLDKAIARVASGGLSAREQEIGKLIKQLATKSIEHITVTQLEDIVQYKIGQFVAEMSDCAAYRKEIAELKVEVEKWQSTAKVMSKQVRDLENVMKKMLNDIKNLPKDALPIPAKVNRSVGLQVGDGRISNEQKKLAIPPRFPEPSAVPARRAGIMTNRPSPNPTTTTAMQPPLTPHTRLRAPVPFSTPPAPLVTPPKRIVAVNPPTLSSPAKPQASVLTFNTPPKLQMAANKAPAASGHVAAGTGMITRQLRPLAPASRQTGLIDLTDESPTTPTTPTTPPAPRQYVTTAAVRQTAPPKLRVITPINPQIAPKPGGSIRLVSQSSLTSSPNARVAYMVPGSATGGEPRMYFSATAPKVPTTNGGSVLTVTRPNNIPQKTVLYSTNVVQASQAPRGTGFKQLTAISSSRAASLGTPGRPRIVERRLVHPAPLPPMPVAHNSNPHWKKSPPHPDLKISKCDKRSRGENGIILSWKMDALCSDHEEIASYQLYAYQETSGEPNTSMWKKVGDVKSMALPMACTLTQFTEGNKYHFAVRAVDARGRTGPFSRPGNILLSVLDN